MNQYADWQLTLTDRERVELQAASIEERLEKIRMFRLAQYEKRLGREASTRLSMEDAEALWEWSTERFRRWRLGGEGARLDPRRLDSNVLDELQERLSDRARSLMEQARERSSEQRDERAILVRNWLVDLFQPSQAVLKATYESLSDEQRAELHQLAELTPEAINQELARHYSRRLGIFGPGEGRTPPIRRPRPEDPGDPDEFSPENSRPGSGNPNTRERNEPDRQRSEPGSSRSETTRL